MAPSERVRVAVGLWETSWSLQRADARAFPIGAEELDRPISLADTWLSKAPVKFVTPEDILLAKAGLVRRRSI
jgi:hypothetical protein